MRLALRALVAYGKGGTLLKETNEIERGASVQAGEAAGENAHQVDKHAAKTPASPSDKVTKHEILAVGVVTLGAFLALLNQTLMAPALPGLMKSFGIDAGIAQWVTSIYLLVNGIMVPVSGWLMDKFSTRKLFFGSMAAFLAGTVVCAVAPNFGLLLVGRVLQAAAAGVQLPLVATVPMLLFPPCKRGTAMGVAGIVMSAGPCVGPVAGGAVIDAFGWRAAFWSVVPIALVVLLAGFFLLSNVGELKNPKLDVPSVLLSTVAFGGMLYGFSSASSAGFSSASVIVPIVVGVVALVAFVKRQRTLDEPLLRLDTLRVPAFRTAALLVTLINASAAATNVILPIYLQTSLGVSALETGMVMLPAAAVGIVLSPISGVVFDKHGARGIGIAGLVLLAGSLCVLGFVNVSTPLVLVAVFCALQASGQALANMPINTWGVNSLPNDLIAHGNALANTGRQVAGAMTTALFTTVMTSVTAGALVSGAATAQATAQGAGAAYLACAAVAAVALVVCVAKVRGKAGQAATEGASEDAPAVSRKGRLATNEK